MAIQFIPQNNEPETISNLLSGVNQALGEGLGFLAQSKMDELRRRRDLAQQEQARQQRLPGLSQILGPEMANAVVGLPDPIIGQLVKQKFAAPGQEAFSTALALLQQGREVPGELLAQIPPNLQYQITNLSFQQKQAQEAQKLREIQELSREKSRNIVQEQKAEAQAVRENKPYLDKLSSGVNLAQNINGLATKMISLLDTGKVASGVSGYLPTTLQSPETQQFDAAANELASVIAGNSGVATNFKIKTAQSYKPNITQNPVTQRALLNELLSKSGKILSTDEIKNYVVAKNNNKQPKNLEGRVKKLSALYEKLPNPNDYDEGTILDGKGLSVKLENGRWVPYLAGEE